MVVDHCTVPRAQLENITRGPPGAGVGPPDGELVGAPSVSVPIRFGIPENLRPAPTVSLKAGLRRRGLRRGVDGLGNRRKRAVSHDPRLFCRQRCPAGHHRPRAGSGGFPVKDPRPPRVDPAPDTLGPGYPPRPTARQASHGPLRVRPDRRRLPPEQPSAPLNVALDGALGAGAASGKESDQRRAVSAAGRAKRPAAGRRRGRSREGLDARCPLHGPRDAN